MTLRTPFFPPLTERGGARKCRATRKRRAASAVACIGRTLAVRPTSLCTAWPSSLNDDCDMSFTLRNIKEDLEDIGRVFDGPPDLEFRAATKALELEKAALSYQRIPP